MSECVHKDVRLVGHLMLATVDNKVVDDSLCILFSRCGVCDAPLTNFHEEG